MSSGERQRHRLQGTRARDPEIGNDLDAGPSQMSSSLHRTGMIGKLGVNIQASQANGMFDSLSTIGYPYLRIGRTARRATLIRLRRIVPSPSSISSRPACSSACRSASTARTLRQPLPVAVHLRGALQRCSDPHPTLLRRQGLPVRTGVRTPLPPPNLGSETEFAKQANSSFVRAGMIAPGGHVANRIFPADALRDHNATGVNDNTHKARSPLPPMHVERKRFR